jgi:DNA-binding XRE family transcriptional regulator
MARRKRTRAVEEFDARVGKWIEGHRKRCGMTARELARQVDITQGSLYWYETGGCACPARVLLAIAAVFDAPLPTLGQNTRSSSFSKQSSFNLSSE